MDAKSPMRTVPEILSRRIVARSRLFRVEQIGLRFGNGQEVDYERLASSGLGAVLVVPMLDDETVLLVREYAAGTNRYELGCPKGRVEAGESLADAANRELKEEIGYGSRRITPIRSMTLAPGYMGHTTHALVAEELYEERLSGDEPEPIEVVPWKLHQLDELFSRSDFTEARSIAALLLVRDRFGRIP